MNDVQIRDVTSARSYADRIVVPVSH